MSLIADYKSGVSGTGRKTGIGSLLCEAGDNFKAYNVPGHRHLPETQQTINKLQKDIAEDLVFVPHLTSMIHGMQATAYLHLKEGAHPKGILRSCYKDNPFIDIMGSGSMPETRSIRGANVYRINIQRAPQNNNVWIILSVIDSLVKGAAGQAV